MDRGWGESVYGHMVIQQSWNGYLGLLTPHQVDFLLSVIVIVSSELNVWLNVWLKKYFSSLKLQKKAYKTISDFIQHLILLLLSNTMFRTNDRRELLEKFIAKQHQVAFCSKFMYLTSASSLHSLLALHFNFKNYLPASACFFQENKQICPRVAEDTFSRLSPVCHKHEKRSNEQESS